MLKRFLVKIGEEFTAPLVEFTSTYPNSSALAITATRRFKKPSTSSLVQTPQTTYFSPSRSFSSSVFTYIKNNKAIPTFLNSLPADNPKIRALQQAIQTGDDQADIFADPQCHLYLLHLIKLEKIPFWQGITTYAYLMALMQFTHKQALKKEDADVKLIRDLTVDKLVLGGKITALGAVFLKTVCAECKAFHYTISYQELADFVLTLPPGEQWLLKIPYDPEGTNDCDKITQILLVNTFFLVRTPLENQEAPEAYWLPSMSFINFIFGKLSPQPILPFPVFGSLGTAELERLHAQGKHPLALYAPEVASNLKTADRFRCGPLPLFIHDLGHSLWANLFTPEERQSIFKDFLTPLKKILQEAECSRHEATIKHLKQIIEEAGDFDLTDLRYFEDASTRLSFYLKRAFRRSPGFDYDQDRSAVYLYSAYSSEQFKPLGEGQEDYLLFLLCKLAQDPTLSPTGKTLWQDLVASIDLNEAFRKTRVSTALKTLANPALTLCSPGNSKINWQTWLQLLNECPDSASLWHKAKKDHHDELLDLIIDCQLSFFHPYLPLTPEKREELRTFTEMQLRQARSGPRL